VVTVQTAAQAAGVRALMRQAGVTPRAAVGPGWAVLRSIAGLRGASGGFCGRRRQGRRG